MSTVVADGLAPLLTDVDRLELLEGNPRRGDIPAVAKSLERFGQRKPIVARRTSSKRAKPAGVVIAGNHTLLAARELGWSQVAVVWVDDDETTGKAFALADNRTAELGSYDDPLLAAMIADVLTADAELLASASFVEDDLTALLASIEAGMVGPRLTDPDDVPTVEFPTPITQPGDVWTLGPHRLVCGDSTDPAVLGAVLGNGRAHVVWTDPPYGVAIGAKNDLLNRAGKGRHDTAPLAGDDDATDAGALWTASFTTLRKTLEPGTPWYCCGPQGSDLGLLLLLLLRDCDMGMRHLLIWVKHRASFSLGRLDYDYAHEPIAYGWIPGGAHAWYRDGSDTSIFEVDRPTASKLHPTMKPVALIAPMIANSSQPGETVLDPFAGSGSTLIAAHDTGRVARLVELDPHYCDVICARYQAHTGTVPTRDGVAHDFGPFDA